ncbi:MAG: uvrA1 [Verrucomicrobiales bacterium]|nr:uvrA1 [Verrucomicrobiales bacterium]
MRGPPLAQRDLRRYIHARMTKSSARPPAIRLRGVRHNNLKNFDLDLPLRKLIVITGLSGSGKSSLAFDTLFAEGQRRYIETFSPYARQFFDRMDKPQVDRIEGIPPAIAIEQRNSVKTTRSTVGTMTELCEYMKLLWPHLAGLYCRGCGELVQKDSPRLVWDSLRGKPAGIEAQVNGGGSHTNGNGRGRPNLRKGSSNRLAGLQAEEPLILAEALVPYKAEPSAEEVLITFELPLSEKLSVQESLALLARQGYQRLLINSEIVRVEEAGQLLQKFSAKSLVVVQDRVKLTENIRARFCEACEQAYHFGKGKITVFSITAAPGQPAAKIGNPRFFSNHFHCAACDIQYREPASALFSFNHPVGACPTCRGFGRTITINYNLALPDRSKTLAGGAVRPWQTGQGAESQADLLRACRHHEVPTNVPFEKLSPKWQDWVINGEPDYGKDEEHQWPRAWYGIKGYFRWLESKAYKMHVRVLLSRYRSYTTCAACAGNRLQPDALLFKVKDAQGHLMTLAQFYQLPVERALEFIQHVATKHSSKPSDPVGLALSEVRTRLGYLVDVGLGYLTLDRPTRSLSGGETERVNLTTCLGTRLVNTLYVLDEPSVGLHPRDTARLVRILENLRDHGNTVVVVEHEASVMRAADQIVDIGPGQGEAGGQIVFQGPYKELTKCRVSLTGQYLSGAKSIEIPERRPVDDSTPRLTVSGASLHNLKDLTVQIPLNRFVCLTGVSGSGKTTLAREIILPCLEGKLKTQASQAAARNGADADEAESGSEEEEAEAGTASIAGCEKLGRIVLVDQSPLGKTPRSNPVVYIGAFDDVRELFAQTELARQLGLSASAFSFNSTQGQCERCRGAGFEKIEMQFLSDVFIRCPDCNGRRYRPHILEVKIVAGTTAANGSKSRKKLSGTSVREWSIADLLDATVNEAIEGLLSFFHLPCGRRALQSLKLLQEVGLGYLRLGQPINTLSGGESQRLKLVSYLAEFAKAEAEQAKPTLFVFDEPTTGLHFEDVRILLKAFHRLVDSGHSLLVVEHNLDVIRSGDWVIDLGPEAGERGGDIVVQGPPEAVAECEESHTGQALQQAFGKRLAASHTK